MKKAIFKRVSEHAGSTMRSVIGLFMLALLTACASKVTVVANIPAPLVEKVPLNVHLAYTDEFKNHVYIESEKKRVLSSINFSDAQAEMFNSVFGQLATLVTADDLSKDMNIEPEILDFQYTAPNETKLKQYEVWVKYRLKITNPDTSKLADWTIKGYGKTPTAMLTSATRAFNSATNIALRDVGAQLSTRFAGQKIVKKIVAGKTDPLMKTSTEELAETAKSSLNSSSSESGIIEEESKNE